MGLFSVRTLPIDLPVFNDVYVIPGTDPQLDSALDELLFSGVAQSIGIACEPTIDQYGTDWLLAWGRGERGKKEYGARYRYLDRES